MSTYVDTVLQNPQYAVLSAISLIAILVVNFSFFTQDEKYPVLIPKKPLELTDRRVVKEFLANSKSLLANARTIYKDQPYRAYTEMGKVLVIPPSWVDALKNNRQLDFLTPAKDASAGDSHQYIPGFGPFGFDPKMPTVINKYITKALTRITGPVSEESSLAIRDCLTDSAEWHAIRPQADLIRVVSRVSSRIFMGEELCRDEEWNRTSSEYTLLAFGYGGHLREYPRWLRPYIHWFLPQCWAIRAKLNEARACLKPHIERRNAIKQKALAEGEPCPFDDSLEWFEREYEKHDPAKEQIAVSIVAYHTTSDLLAETLLNLCQYPKVLQELREEIVDVLKAEGGMTKAALYNLKLMDSVVKESQRMRPILLGAFRRVATADVTLPNGDILKKGDKIIGNMSHMWDSDTYDNALQFDPYRFVKMRQTGDDKKAHLVSTSADHLGFGHGYHACPGRFFAANEIKILLCHLLLKYDWKLPEGCKPQPSFSGFKLLGDYSSNLLVRRRNEELDFDSLSSS
ncbi:probable cytochrome P450 monooxygenase (lovA) [Fusarium fujikuroi IMI 58289]|uniref:Probable cytochrome P450 monooxygenase (LovA) n=1 Tax=Gibberella fujikuroi (strain CBS 195.34 / IMI 58289 / NRRL A-6831) TaxID=1279085 RepID=S0EMK0_GIBF5|nr:probable cytochrome P450 monooxygenase (lovA) [Fusarium fujikuroi IMI 58289]CCT75112.1 probable cytochrome P450 monooxygenase (lovA) [Fusarium fujikuroi IMI 58289]SCO26362.1 probable cytochrome P450 monooxygenase (lovA) [Fusarium fujikuroi]